MTATAIEVGSATQAQSPFVRLDGTSPRRFRKEVLRVWEGVDADGRAVKVDREMLDRLARNTNRWTGLGHEVWGPDGHTEEAMKNLGSWSSFEVEGDRLFGVFEAADDDVASKVGTRMKGVSIFAQPEVASNGEAFDQVIQHVCLTPCPVLPGQSNFVRLARTTKEKPMDPKATAAKTELKLSKGDDAASGAGAGEAPKDLSPKEASLKLEALLGLESGATWSQIVDAVRSCLIDEEEEGADATAMPGNMASMSPGYVSRLSRGVAKAKAEVKAELSKELEALKAKETARAHAHADELVSLARKRSVEVGSPLGEDDCKLVLSYLKSGDDRLEKAGRDLLASHETRWRDVLSLSRGQRAAVPAEEAKASEAVKASDAAVSEMCLSRGLKYDPATKKAVRA